MHVTDVTAAFERMVGALAPGGWLLIEEKDSAVGVTIDSWHPLAEGYGHPDAAAVTATVKKMVTSPGGKVAGMIGYSLPEKFAEAGLVDVDHELVGRIVRGGEPWAQVLEAVMRFGGPKSIEDGVMTQADLDLLLRVLNDPTFTFLGYLNVAAWGGRPPA